MGVPGDFPGIFIQGYGFDFDGVGTFVVQQGDGVFAGRFDQFGNVKRMFLPGQGGRRPCADPGRIEKVRFVYLADDVPGKLDPHQIHTLAIRFQAFFEIRKILFTGGSPADFRKGAGTGECLVVQAFRCGNPFRPYLGAQSLDSGMVLFLQPGENGFEPVCLLQGNAAVAVIQIGGGVEGIDNVMPVPDGVFSQAGVALPELDDGVCIQFGAGFSSSVPIDVMSVNFIPSHHAAPFLGNNAGHAVGEMHLDVRITFHAVFFHEFLNFRNTLPLLVIAHFISANVDDSAGEERRDFIQNIGQEGISFFRGGIEGRIDDECCGHFPGSFQAQEGVCYGGGAGMARHFNFRNDGDVSAGCVLYDIPDLFLGIKAFMRRSV